MLNHRQINRQRQLMRISKWPAEQDAWRLLRIVGKQKTPGMFRIPALVALLFWAVEESGEVAEVIPVSSKIESELSELSDEDRAEFLASLGLEEPGLHRLIRMGYHLLGLHTYFTAGEKEVRAWTIPVGAKAPEAAGVIHSDFERGFIRAETISYDDFQKVGSVKAARDQGMMRSEGKEYVVQDGDILLFRFNV